MAAAPPYQDPVSEKVTMPRDPSDVESQGTTEPRTSGQLDREADRSEALQKDGKYDSTKDSIKQGEPIAPHDHRTLDRVSTTGSRHSDKLSKTASRRERERLEREPIPQSDMEKGIVGWDGQDDPAHPVNFPQSRKYLLLGMIAAITFLSPLASSIFASGVSFMDQDFHNTSSILSSFTVSIFVLGYTFGPLFLSPLSEIYGRRPVLFTANCFFVIWQLACALAPNLGALLAFRFLAGLGGSGCLTVGAGLIADTFPRDQRGVATALYSMGPLFGPVIGPVIGGFIAQRAGWRWIFWVLLIACATVCFGMEIFNAETNVEVLIKRKTLRLQKELNRPELRSAYQDETKPQSPGAILKTGLLRPLKMLFFSPIVFLLALYMSVVYGLLYLLFTTMGTVFIETYHWAPDITGLVFLSLGLGFVIGITVVARLSDATLVRLTKANNGVPEPEMRLPACIIFACFVPITFFWYGWTADKGVYWLVPVLGLIPFAIGMMGIFLPIQTYLIDAFPSYAASAVAAVTAMRSLFGAVLPLAAPSMYKKLGLGWGNSLLGFIAIALIPAPSIIYRYGGAIRRKYPIKL